MVQNCPFCVPPTPQLLHGVADEAVHAGGRLHAVEPDDAADDVDGAPHRDILESDLDD